MSWLEVLEQENWAHMLYCVRQGVAVIIFSRARRKVLLEGVRVNFLSPDSDAAYAVA